MSQFLRRGAFAATGIRRACASAIATAGARRQMSRVTVDEAEIRKFSALSNQWWQDDVGPFAGLHRMNAVRIPLIRQAILNDNNANSRSIDVAKKPLDSASVLDVGCGGGILSEALARLGANVTGIDAATANVAAATYHSRLDPALSTHLQYQCITVEDLSASGVQFDCVVCSEVIEHVADMQAFVKCLAGLVRPGGHLVLTTINRTVQSFGLAILAAEYVLRIVPAGTHEWTKFVPPADLASAIKDEGMEVTKVTGLFYNALNQHWSYTADTRVNYGMVARKPSDATATGAAPTSDAAVDHTEPGSTASGPTSA